MKEAVIPGYKLTNAKRSTKVLLSMALVGLFLGLIGAVILTLSRTGISPEHVTRYYRGTAAASDGSLGSMLVESRGRSFNQLAEVTHFHLVGGSLLLFLLCHLLSICVISENLKVFFYTTTFSLFILTFGSPWLIVYVHPMCAWIYGASTLGFLAMLFLLTAIPFYEMWWKRKTNLVSQYPKGPMDKTA